MMIQSMELVVPTTNDLQSLNQQIRWIETKEDHCTKIITLVGTNLLCDCVQQEMFESESDYEHALQAHHLVLQAAVRAKQTMDLKSCDALDVALKEMADLYNVKNSNG